jgi:hypothetical protein
VLNDKLGMSKDTNCELIAKTQRNLPRLIEMVNFTRLIRWSVDGPDEPVPNIPSKFVW